MLENMIKKGNSVLVTGLLAGSIYGSPAYAGDNNGGYVGDDVASYEKFSERSSVDERFKLSSTYKFGSEGSDFSNKSGYTGGSNTCGIGILGALVAGVGAIPAFSPASDAGGEAIGWTFMTLGGLTAIYALPSCFVK